MTVIKPKLFSEINSTIDQLDITTISEARITILQSLIDFVESKTDKN